jgi:DNA repair protein RecO (recombination protein O)
VFLRKSTEALDLLTEAKLERRFRVGRGDLGPLYAGYYIAELLDALTDDYDPHPDLYAIADQTLAMLSSQRPRVVVRGQPPPATESPITEQPIQNIENPVVSRLVVRFELVTLRILGHLPSLDVCVECGSPVPLGGRIAFGHLAGGVLCAKCRPGQRNVVSVTSAAIESMKILADTEHEQWRSIDLPRSAQGELRGILSRYLAHLIGRETRMQTYLSRSN